MSHGRFRSARSSRQVSHGFTLTELLVVIGIIALLVAILMPALTRARFQARVTTCEARLSQWGAAVTMYANENKGYFPRFDDHGDVNCWDMSTEFYDLFRARGMPHEMFFCPLHVPEMVDENGGWWMQTYPAFYRLGYSFWIPRLGTGGMLPPRTDASGKEVAGPIRLSDPATSPIITDWIVSNGSPNVNLAANDNSGLYSYSQHIRDGLLVDSSNEAYSDGHVERVSGDQLKARFLSPNGYWNWR